MRPLRRFLSLFLPLLLSALLAACATGTVGVHADIVGIHLNIYVLLNIGPNVAGHKGSLALARGVKGRYTHQTVHPVL